MPHCIHFTMADDPISVTWFTSSIMVNPYFGQLPSGNRLHNDGKSPFLISKLTISIAVFNSKLLNYRKVILVADARNTQFMGWNLESFSWFPQFSILDPSHEYLIKFHHHSSDVHKFDPCIFEFISPISTFVAYLPCVDCPEKWWKLKTQWLWWFSVR